jgi:hypothetical protein
MTQMTPMPWTFAHERPVEHMPVLAMPEPQQGWPLPPHATHAIPASAPGRHAPPAWQLLPAQQAPPRAPQFEHVRPPMPGASAQPSPLPQVLPAQQAWPSPPHGRQLSPPSPGWQARPVPQLFAPPQHA